MNNKIDYNFDDLLNKHFSQKRTTGDVIRSKRKSLNLTLEEVAQVTNIDKCNLSNIENDRKSIGINTAIKIGLVIGLHPITILYPNGLGEEFGEISRKSKKLLDKKKKTA